MKKTYTYSVVGRSRGWSGSGWYVEIEATSARRAAIAATSMYPSSWRLTVDGPGGGIYHTSFGGYCRRVNPS